MSPSTEKFRDFLCGHAGGRVRLRGHRAECPSCGSYWDREFHAEEFVYDGSYPELRHHHDPRVAALKVRTFNSWLAKAGIAIEPLTVCEVGFGGGACLKDLSTRASRVFGIEAVPENLEAARRDGIREVYPASDLPPSLPAPVDLWVFQDSFEHIVPPEPFARWMGRNSSPSSRVLLVAPRADSASERLMGRFWVHRIRDHRFQWSRAGIEKFFLGFGFRLTSSFFPTKYVSPLMVLRHLSHKFPGAAPALRALDAPAGLGVPFNFGEMGLVFTREPRA